MLIKRGPVAFKPLWKVYMFVYSDRRAERETTTKPVNKPKTTEHAEPPTVYLLPTTATVCSAGPLWV